jgi:hypothetical protein
MTDFNSIISFRIALVLGIFMLLNSNAYSQSKKEQIQLLNARLDSLKTIQSNEKQSSEKRKYELESSITLSYQKITELLKTLSNKKENLKNQIQENQKLDQEILSLQSDLKSIEDSIQAIIDDQPIKLLESGLINISNDELISLMNVTAEDLGDAFVNRQNPEIKPTYEIIGKQSFQIKGKVFCMVVMGVTNPNTAHVSSGTNFIACFEIKNNQLKLIHPAFNTEFNPAAGFGIPALFDKFVLFGNHNLAVILKGGWAGMGYIMETRTIFGLNNRNEVFSIYSGYIEENDQMNKGSSMFTNLQDEYEISFQKTTSSKYYDLFETKKSHGKKVKTTTLKFNETTMKYE